MNKRRLLKLADLLEADAKNKKGIKFDLSTLGQASNGEGFVPGEREPSVSCWTSACALGLAAISGAFNRQGFSYEISHYGDIDCTINGRAMYFADAAVELFGITSDAAYFLFSPSCYEPDDPIEGAKGERYVAKRIRDFVAGKVSPS